jgi:site-specific recombinase XerD
MIDDMTVRNLAPNTMLCYLKQVSYLARYFGRSPAQLGPEEIREYQLYLAQDRKVSVSSRLVAITALRFLYGVTLKRDRFIEMLPTPRKEHYLPVILSPAEVLRFLQAAPSYSPIQSSYTPKQSKFRLHHWQLFLATLHPYNLPVG